MFEKQSFALNGAVSIEYLEWSAKDAEIASATVLLVPGFLAAARDWAATPLVGALLAGGFSRVVALSLRGRGESDSPDEGWSLSHHVADIDSVLHDLGVAAVHLIGHSVGASYGLAYALSRPERVLSLTLGDFPPILPPFDADQTRSDAEQSGRRMTTAFLEGMTRDSAFVNLAPRLGSIEQPVLILRGTSSDVMEPMDLEMFDLVPDKTIVELRSDHEVFASPEAAKAVMAFLARR